MPYILPLKIDVLDVPSENDEGNILYFEASFLMTTVTTMRLLFMHLHAFSVKPLDRRLYSQNRLRHANYGLDYQSLTD